MAAVLLCAVALASSTSAWLPSELSSFPCRNERRTPHCVDPHGRRERRRAVLGRAAGDEEGSGSSGEGTPASPPSLDLGSLTGMSEAARKAFGDMKFETELDDETRKQYEEAIAAEFDRNVKELESVGDELRGESQQSLDNLKRAAEANMKEAEASAAQIEAYGKRVETMTERVKAETSNVAREVETLQALRDEMKNDPLLRLGNFREQGYVLLRTPSAPPKRAHGTLFSLCRVHSLLSIST